jgi:hypothetical protein
MTKKVLNQEYNNLKYNNQQPKSDNRQPTIDNLNKNVHSL